MRWVADTGYNGWNTQDGSIGENKLQDGWNSYERTWNVACLPGTVGTANLICSLYHGPFTDHKCIVSNATNLWLQGTNCSLDSPTTAQAGSPLSLAVVSHSYWQAHAIRLWSFPRFTAILYYAAVT